MKRKRIHPVKVGLEMWRRDMMVNIFRQLALNRSLPLWSRVQAGRVMVVVILNRMRFYEGFFREMENKS